MILETLLTEKPSVRCTIILGLIFSTGRRSSTQGANFLTLVCFIVQSVTAVTYILFAIAPFKLVLHYNGHCSDHIEGTISWPKGNFH